MEIKSKFVETLCLFDSRVCFELVSNIYNFFFLFGICSELIDAGFGGGNFPDEDYPCSWYKGKGTEFLLLNEVKICFTISEPNVA